MCICAVCGNNATVKVEYFKYCNFSISSDNRIVKNIIQLYRCDACGHLQKELDLNILEEIYSTYCTDSVIPNSEITLCVGGGGE